MMGTPGTVYLVGAGPGDPELLTLRARDLIAAADVILYDRLIPKQALKHARGDAELLYVGKQSYGPAVDQRDIEKLLVKYAQEDKIVVRLKGGDPYVFGRGGEEALVLLDAGIPFEVVPGVTAGIAAAAYAGIPSTHRGLASGVALVTGNEDPTKDHEALNWDALAGFPGTLIFYMGVRNLPHIAAELIASGRSSDEPATVIEKGTYPSQRTVTGTLATIADRAAEQGIRAPAVTVVGAPCAYADRLAWAEKRSLQGAKIVVTRARSQASSLARKLKLLGAEVVEAPMIRTVPVPATLPDLGEFDLICFTSTNGVEQFFALLAEAGLDARALAGCKIATIGPGTTKVVQQYGITADITPARSITESLIEALTDVQVERALIVRGKQGRELLAEALLNRGAAVENLTLYDTVAEPIDDETLEAVKTADYITFTSGSTVRNFETAVGISAVNGARLISIGPATTEAMASLNITPHAEATTHTPDGIVETLVSDSVN